MAGLHHRFMLLGQARIAQAPHMRHAKAMNPTGYTLAPAQERLLIALLALVQFVNMLDFVMVMPLGPDFAHALNIPNHSIGLVGGSYSFAAALAGILSSPFLDKFPRKTAMLFCLAGVVVSTLATTQVWDLHSMLAARILAGAFGGQMMALSQAMVADFIPPQRRGAAMGAVAGGFAAASVVGIPFGLELSNYFGWQAPFVVAGLAGLVVLVIGQWKLPYRAAMAAGDSLVRHFSRMGQLLANRHTLASYAMMGLAMGAGFLIVPNVSAHLQLNMGYPRDYLGLLYMCGGAVSFFSMRFSGYLVDKYSATMSASLFTTLVLIVTAIGFVFYAMPAATVPMWIVVMIFVGFMVGMSGRNVCCMALSSKIPPPDQRGLYMSLQSAVTSFSAAVGAYGSSFILSEGGGHLLHVDRLGLMAIGISALVPLVVQYVECNLRRRLKAEASSLAATPPVV